MNKYLRDNRVTTMVNYYKENLQQRYSPEESSAMVYLVFQELKGWNRAELKLHERAMLSESELLRFHFCLKELSKGRPVQYVIGRTEFYGCELKVDERVLIPRPETEELVEWVIQSVKENHLSMPCVVDVGTGSGCISIAIKKNIPNSRVLALDVSSGALQLASFNAEKNQTQIEFLLLDVLQPTTWDSLPEMEVLISNPPYVLESDKKEMSEHVVNYEPSVALFVPDLDPLVFYKAIKELALQKLKTGGMLFLEIHEKLGKETLELFRSEGFSSSELRKDLSGRDRMIKVIRD